MRFSEFLKEDVSLLSTSLQPFKKNISAMLKQQKYFYRIQTHGKFKTDKKSGMTWAVIPERDTPRKSLSGNNMLMYISTKWKNVPDRSMSYYSSQTKDSFGTSDQYLIIPADSIKKFGFTHEDFNFDDRTKSRETPMLIINIIAEVYEAFLTIKHEHKSLSPINIILDKLSEKYNFDRGRPISIERIPLDKIGNFFKFIDAIYLKYNELSKDKSSSPSTIYFMHALNELRERIESEGYSSVAEALESIKPETWGVTGYSSFTAIPKSYTQDNEMWWRGAYLAIGVESGDHPDVILNQLNNMLVA